MKYYVAKVMVRNVETLMTAELFREHENVEDVLLELLKEEIVHGDFKVYDYAEVTKEEYDLFHSFVPFKGYEV